MKKKIAVVLFNLGGPDKLSSVKEFLFNLFYDKAIISLANPFRWLLAKFISIIRNKKSQKIYSQMGGASTILPITKKQAYLLEKELKKTSEKEYKVFISMRYWHPFSKDIIKDIEKFAPDEIILLPLYPQFSTTTTKSSLDDFKKILDNSEIKLVKRKFICCYYNDPYFVKSHVELIKKSLLGDEKKYRILFSAHSIPEYLVKNGDPYQWQIEETCKIIAKELNIEDYIICYQSKVGKLKWLEPSTEQEIKKAAQEDVSILIVPIAFVSDHSETLVELDIDYKKIFYETSKTASYIRVESLNENNNFILSLANQIYSDFQERKCPKNFCKCYYLRDNKNG